MPANIIVFTDAKDSAAAKHWIGSNCRHFFEPGHDILFTKEPSAEQLASNACIVVPDPADYYALLTRGWHIRNVVVLGTPIDLRDTQQGAGRVRAAVGFLNGLLAHSLKVGSDLADQNTALKARIVELEAGPIVTLPSTPNDEPTPLKDTYDAVSGASPAPIEPPAEQEAAAPAEDTTPEPKPAKAKGKKTGGGHGKQVPETDEKGS